MYSRFFLGGITTAIMVLLGMLFMLPEPLYNTEIVFPILFSVGILSASFLFFRHPQWFVPVAIVCSIAIQLCCIFIDEAHNDIYRYLWDGYASERGANVYEVHPWQTYEEHAPHSDESETLWENVNFKKYYTTYPAVPQLFFWLSVELMPNSQVMLKFLFFLVQLGSICALVLLSRTTAEYSSHSSVFLSNISRVRSWIPTLVLSPLFVWEGTAAGHTEVLLVFFLLWSMVCIRKKWFLIAGICAAGMVWTKFFPLVFGPLFLAALLFPHEQHISWKQRIFSVVKMTIGFMGASVLVWYPFFPFDTQYLQEGIEIYRERWEMSPLFFGGVEYFFSRETALSFHLWATVMVMVWSIVKRYSLPFSVFLVGMTYLLFSSTIFSWYFLWGFVLLPFVFCHPHQKYALEKFCICMPLFLLPPLQYMFGIQEEFGFQYAHNGTLLEQQIFFWGLFFMGVMFAAVYRLYQYFLKLRKDCKHQKFFNFPLIR